MRTARPAPIDGWSGSVDLEPLRAGVDGRNACSGASPRMTMEHVTALALSARRPRAVQRDVGSAPFWHLRAVASTADRTYGELLASAREV